MFFGNKLQLKTVGYAQNDYGEYEDDVEETLSYFRGSIQPLNQEEKRLINKNGEGNESLFHYKLYTPSNVIIRTKGNKSGYTDTVLFNNKEFEVISCDQFLGGLINHNKYILQQLTEEGEEDNASEI